MQRKKSSLNGDGFLFLNVFIKLSSWIYECAE